MARASYTNVWSVSSEGMWVGASINGAAGIRLCDLRCPESVVIIRMVSGDGEQEMITEFSPQIQDSTENYASSRSGGLGCRSWHGLSSPWLGILESMGRNGGRKILWVGRFPGEPALRLWLGWSCPLIRGAVVWGVD